MLFCTKFTMIEGVLVKDDESTTLFGKFSNIHSKIKLLGIAVFMILMMLLLSLQGWIIDDVVDEIKKDLGWPVETPPWGDGNIAESRLWCWDRYLELSSELYVGSNNKNLKRHAVSFTKGLPGASKMRVELHSMPTQEKMGMKVKQYLEELTELDIFPI